MFISDSLSKVSLLSTSRCPPISKNARQVADREQQQNAARRDEMPEDVHGTDLFKTIRTTRPMRRTNSSVNPGGRRLRSKWRAALAIPRDQSCGLKQTVEHSSIGMRMV
jgi:hypothetical protein